MHDAFAHGRMRPCTVQYRTYPDFINHFSSIATWCAPAPVAQHATLQPSRDIRRTHACRATLLHRAAQDRTVARRCVCGSTPAYLPEQTSRARVQRIPRVSAALGLNSAMDRRLKPVLAQA
jgi:hypothetical protein